MGRRAGLRGLRRAERGAPPVGLLRGSTHRERHTGHPPRRSPRLQGRLSPLPDDEGVLRAPPGGLGLPRPAGRAGRGEGARVHGQAGHRGLRGSRVQRPLPGVRAPACRRVRRHDPAHGLLGRHGPRLLDHGQGLRPERLVVTEAHLRPGPPRPGSPRRALLPPMRHRTLRPRARPGLRDGRRSVRVRTVPAAHGRAPRPAVSGREPAGLDNHPMDTRVEHRRGRQARRDLRRRPHRRRDARRRRGAHRRHLRRRRGHRPGDDVRLRPGAGGLRAPVRLRRHPGRALRAAGRTTARAWSTRHRHSAPTTL